VGSRGDRRQREGARGLGEAYVTELLDAYGGPCADELADFIAAHELYTRIWRAHVARRRSEAGRPR
jgi:hypothetical protein